MSDNGSAWEAWDRLIHGRDPDPLEVLRSASQFQRYFEAVQSEAAKAARTAGHTWDEIGHALGVTRQAARERFASPEHRPLQRVSGAGSRRRPRR